MTSFRARNLLAIACASVALIPATACSRTPNPISVGVDTMYYGYITSGHKFGVTIGDTRKSARHVLESRGYHFGGEGSCDSRMQQLIHCTSDYRDDIYRVSEFMKDGFIFLQVQNETIVAIVWKFEAIRNPDF